MYNPNACALFINRCAHLQYNRLGNTYMYVNNLNVTIYVHVCVCICTCALFLRQTSLDLDKGTPKSDIIMLNGHCRLYTHIDTHAHTCTYVYAHAHVHTHTYNAIIIVDYYYCYNQFNIVTYAWLCMRYAYSS